jgi:hypothetical protein
VLSIELFEWLLIFKLFIVFVKNRSIRLFLSVT